MDISFFQARGRALAAHACCAPRGSSLLARPAAAGCNWNHAHG
jgi:hypothetical protein